MTLPSELGQASFVEVIRVDPFVGTTCESKAILGNSRWQNPRNRFAVTGGETATEADYSALLNWIAVHGEGQLPALKPDNDPWVDVNGDGIADAKDLQQLADHLQGVVDGTDPVCHDVYDFRIERDILDPAQIIKCGGTPTVRSAACHKNIIPTANYTPYFNLYTGILETTWDAAIKTKDSIIYVHNDLLVPRNPYFAGCSETPRVLNRILRRLQTEIFPHRYDWRRPPCIPGQGPAAIPDDPIFADVGDLPEAATTTPEPEFGLLTRVVIINIFEASERYLTTEDWYAQSTARLIAGPVGFEATGTNYGDDKYLWEEFIDSIDGNDAVNVKVGILHPQGTGDVWPTAKPLPKDSYRDAIDYIPFEQKAPPISAANIINSFYMITENGKYDPTLLIFVYDEADRDKWASQITKAIAKLKVDFPKMATMRYPFSKSFDRWLMMDLDAMLQLMYQRDNVNAELTSLYRTGGVEGTLTDPAPFQALRQTHIEYRLANNTMQASWSEVEWDAFNPEDPIYDGSVYGQPKSGKKEVCFPVMKPYDWEINYMVGENPQQRGRRRFITNPFYVFGSAGSVGPGGSSQGTGGPYSSANFVGNSLVGATFQTVDSATTNTVQLRPIYHYAHWENRINLLASWYADYFGGIEKNIRVDAILSAGRIFDASRIFLEQQQEGKYHTIYFSPLQFPVTHLDPGFFSAGTGYYVSVWYNDLHAIVTEGKIPSPATVKHYSGGPGAGVNPYIEPYGERQRAIAVYSDPDFQDKIYNTVKYYVEQRANILVLSNSYAIFSGILWQNYVALQRAMGNKWPWEVNQGGNANIPTNIISQQPTSFVLYGCYVVA